MCVRCVCVALVFLFFILITLGYILYFTLLISSVIFLSLSFLLRLFFISPLCEMKNGPPAVSVTLWEDERVKMNMRMRMRLFEWRCVTAGQAKVVREMSLVIPDFLTHGLSPLSLSIAFGFAVVPVSLQLLWFPGWVCGAIALSTFSLEPECLSRAPFDYSPLSLSLSLSWLLPLLLLLYAGEVSLLSGPFTVKNSQSEGRFTRVDKRKWLPLAHFGFHFCDT